MFDRFTVRARKVMGLARQEAQRFSHDYIGTEHLVLGMLRQADGIAALVLQECDVQIEAAREEILEIIGSQPEDVQPEDDQTSRTPALAAFGTDLTQLGGDDDLDLSGANTQDIQELARTLSRKTMNCAVLVSEAHRERLAVVHGLARVIGSSALPSYLKNMRIVELDTQMMLAGSKYRGMFEERAQAVLKELQRHRNVVLFIEDLRLLAGGRGARYDADIEFGFQTALLRGEFQCITTATPEVYASCRANHSIVDAVFRPLTVRAPSARKATQVLQSKIPSLGAHHVVMSRWSGRTSSSTSWLPKHAFVHGASPKAVCRRSRSAKRKSKPRGRRSSIRCCLRRSSYDYFLGSFSMCFLRSPSSSLSTSGVKCRAKTTLGSSS